MAWPASSSPSQPDSGTSIAQGGPLEPSVTPVQTIKTKQHDSSELPPPAYGWQQPHPTKILLEWPLPATGVNSLFGTRIDPVDGSERFHNGMNGVIAGSEVQAKYVRRAFPRYRLINTLTHYHTDLAYYERARDVYDIFVLPPALNHRADFMPGQWL